MRFSILLILGLVGCTGSPAPVSSPTPAPPTTPPPAVVSEPTPEPAPAWKPTGDDWRGQNDQAGDPVWFRKAEPDCGPYRYCLNYEVTTEAGCDSLYVQASLRNEAGQNIGWTNDTIQGLRPKEIGLLTLGASEPGNFTLDEINCR